MTIAQTHAELIEAKTALDASLNIPAQAKPIHNCFAVFTDGYELDQICDTHKQAMKEARDLRKMGCGVKVLGFFNEQEACAYADKRAGRITDWH